LVLETCDPYYGEGTGWVPKVTTIHKEKTHQIVSYQRLQEAHDPHECGLCAMYYKMIELRTKNKSPKVGEENGSHKKGGNDGNVKVEEVLKHKLKK
jgi:hypothetical protein